MALSQTRPYCRFRVGSCQLALPLEDVQEWQRMVAVAEFPGSTRAVSGVVDWRGQITPVINLAHRFRQPAGSPRLTDYLLLVRAGARNLALWVNEAVGLIFLAIDQITDIDAVSAQSEGFLGVARGPDGLILIQDLEKLLSQEESAALDQAMEALIEQEQTM